MTGGRVHPIDLRLARAARAEITPATHAEFNALIAIMTEQRLLLRLVAADATPEAFVAKAREFPWRRARAVFPVVGSCGESGTGIDRRRSSFES
jgi:hypothetical protein